MLRFLKPDLRKIALSIFLFIVSSLLWRAFVISRISDTFPLGFPFQFHLAWGPCPPGKICSDSNVSYLILDAVIWYTASALLVERFWNKK